MNLNTVLLVSVFTLFSLQSFANPNLQEFVRKVEPSANYLDQRLREHNCHALLEGGEVTTPYYPDKYIYFPYPTGPALRHRYNANEPNKNDSYRFIIEPAFQSEFKQIISSAVANRFPGVSVEVKTGSSDLVDYHHVRITHVTNGNLDFNTIEFSVVAPPETLNRLEELFRTGFPFK